MRLPKVDERPMWLQFLVLGPHAILAGVLLWVWWPKSDKAKVWDFGRLSSSVLGYVVFRFWLSMTSAMLGAICDNRYMYPIRSNKLSLGAERWVGNNPRPLRRVAETQVSARTMFDN